MPGRGEYGLLQGLGVGLANAAKMGFAASLQAKRDERLAKIAQQAAEGRYAQEKELLGLRAESGRELATHRANEDVRGKKEVADYYLQNGLGVNGRSTSDKEATWNIIEGTNDLGDKMPTGVMRGDEYIDFSSDYGKVVKGLIDRGAPISNAVAGAREMLSLRQNQSAMDSQGNDGGAERPLPPGRSGSTISSPAADSVDSQPRFVDRLSGFIDAAKVVAPALNPVTRGLLSRGQDVQIDPQIQSIRDKLNNPDPSQRSIPNSVRGDYLGR